MWEASLVQSQHHHDRIHGKPVICVLFGQRGRQCWGFHLWCIALLVADSRSVGGQHRSAGYCHMCNCYWFQCRCLHTCKAPGQKGTGQVVCLGCNLHCNNPSYQQYGCQHCQPMSIQFNLNDIKKYCHFPHLSTAPLPPMFQVRGDFSISTCNIGHRTTRSSDCERKVTRTSSVFSRYSHTTVIIWTLILDDNISIAQFAIYTNQTYPVHIPTP